MKTDQTALERAFEIARTGACEKIDDIRRQVSREGYDPRQIEGIALVRQLMDTSRKARESTKSE